MNIRRASSMMVLVVVVSLGMAAVFIRIPTLWPLMPALLSDGIASAFKVGSQEQAANVEFISAWVLCFGVLVAIWIVAVTMRRGR
jgi:divalent metal cation (Fe/Co/Zn/Cd) transporter